MGFFNNIADFFVGDNPEIATPQDRRVKNVNSTGFSTSLNGNSFDFNRKQVVDDLLAGNRSLSGAAASDIRTLRDKVSPGFGDLTTSRVNAVTDAKDRAISNLGDNLRRRRVAGSSFGNDAMARTEAEFGRQEADVRAQSFLEELTLTDQLIKEELAVNTNAITQELNYMLQESNIAANLVGVAQTAATNLTNVMSQVASANATLQGQALAGTGKFLGFGADKLFGSTLDGVGGKIKEAVLS